MKGHGEKLSRNQEAALLALLTEPTLAKAAVVAGVSEATLWRWLQLPDFQERYRAARTQLVENALVGLQQATAEAVACLRRNLKDPASPRTQVEASKVILEHSLKAVEVLDLESRIAKLEEHNAQLTALLEGLSVPASVSIESRRRA